MGDPRPEEDPQLLHRVVDRAFQVLIVPLFLVVRRVPLAGGNDILGNGGTGWLNTWAALIVPFVSAPL